jgi:hypothetical protein
MDEYMQRLAALDPELARALQDPGIAQALKEQDQRLAAEEWRRRHPRDAARQSEEARVREIVIPLIARAYQLAMNDLRAEFRSADDVVKEHLRRELRSLTRRARLRRWSKKDAERFAQTYVQSLPKASDIK